jgi:hypothetical protein
VPVAVARISAGSVAGKVQPQKPTIFYIIRKPFGFEANLGVRRHFPDSAQATAEPAGRPATGFRLRLPRRRKKNLIFQGQRL